MITKFDRAAEAQDVAYRFEQQYSHYIVPKRSMADGRYPEDIVKQLKDLGSPVNPDDVDKIIGNKSWTHTICDECGDDEVAEAIVFDAEYVTLCLCMDCLRSANEIAAGR